MGASPPASVADLVERFSRDRKVFLSPEYKEEQLRAVCLTIWRSTFGARTFHAEFHGKVSRLTAGHQAKVEEKPEVRKAGGVYYTPTYIVDYIVKNTVGKPRQGGSPAHLTFPARTTTIPRGIRTLVRDGDEIDKMAPKSPC
jgi:hypothetical protein